MTTCRDFRAALESTLAGRARQVAALGWHEHLLACDDCRALLQSEEALEALLASLPAPRLEAGLSARVLARLTSERESVRSRALPERDLDSLLERDAAVTAPRDLAQRVLAGLGAQRNDAALDGLLARWTQPLAPRGLAARTLTALRVERRRALPRPVPRGLVRLAAGLLVAAGIGLGLRALWRAPTPRADLVEAAPPSPELLATLELLEAWDLLTDDSLEVALTSLDEADAILLEIERGGDPLADEPSESATTPPSKG